MLISITWKPLFKEVELKGDKQCDYVSNTLKYLQKEVFHDFF